jgi:integrase
MARTRDRLSAVKIQGLKNPGYYADGGNLYFRVADGGTKAWMFRFAMHGRKRDMGLGPYPDVSLAKARDLAAECREQIRGGIDPIEARKAQRAADRIAAAKAMTFDECRIAYIASHEAGWRNAKHRQQWTNSLKTCASPTLGRLPVASVDTALVMKVIEPIWRTTPETASRVRGRIESVLDWAKVRGFRSGENPARWRGHLDQLLPAKTKIRAIEHFAALPHSQVGEFMGELRQQTGVTAAALQFLILCAARANEVLGARWSEIDLTARTWTVPAARMKSASEHRVPLSAAAIDVLGAMHKIRRDDYVFPAMRGDGHLSQNALWTLLRRRATAHGFRSTFRDWVAECTNCRPEIAEAALAHKVSDAVVAAYRRTTFFDTRRELMAKWAEYCATPAPASGDNVVSLRA